MSFGRNLTLSFFLLFQSTVFALSCPASLSKLFRKTGNILNSALDFYFSPIVLPFQTLKLGFSSLGVDERLKLIQEIKSNGKKALPAIAIFGIAPTGCAASLSVVDTLGESIFEQNKNDHIVIIDAFTDRENSEDFHWWHPLASQYHIQRVERLRKDFPHISYIKIKKFSDLKIKLELQVKKFGTIDYVEFYGHGGTQSVVTNEDYLWKDSLHKSGLHLLSQYFSDNAKISMKQCLVGHAKNHLLESIKEGIGRKDIHISGAQVPTLISPLKEPLEFAFDVNIPSSIGIASDYISGPLRLYACAHNYFSYTNTLPTLKVVRNAGETTIKTQTEEPFSFPGAIDNFDWSW